MVRQTQSGENDQTDTEWGEWSDRHRVGSMIRQTQRGENGQTDTEPGIGYHIIPHMY